MAILYHVGTQSVDRAKREMVLWVMQLDPNCALPITYSFFCGVLVELFTGLYFSSERFMYEGAGWLESPEPFDDRHEGLDRQSKSPEIFAEHVEMIRWSGKVYEADEGDEWCVDDENNEDSWGPQAEYLVRVTDSKYMSCRADPCFIGHYYMGTACHEDNDTQGIEMGPWQPTLLRPLESFLVTRERGLTFLRYVDDHMSTIDQCLLELPKILKHRTCHQTSTRNCPSIKGKCSCPSSCCAIA
jgi:hypothetical protein